MKTRKITIQPTASVPFGHHSAMCVGTGRMGLALHQEYLEQLAAVQDVCGFSYIRGHGLFHEDMGIYQPWTDENGTVHEAYCFTYLDRVMDAYRKVGLKPFLELGFMPKAMASGKQTIFFWEGNTTPPADDDRWTALVKATLRHLVERYGETEVATWPVEVWNEPNLAGFWENADQAKYFHLYDITSRAVKEVLPVIRVGGPVICGGTGSQEWVRDFLIYCRDHHCPIDYVSRHAYMAQTPERKGWYVYHVMCSPQDTLNEMLETRHIIDGFPEFCNLPMIISEFNTSYNPRAVIHDTNLNAAYIAGLLSLLGDAAEGYSYWTFGDVFEESGIPHTPFHGGFGMMADGCIPKPTLWTFAFFNRLRGDCVYRDENLLMMRDGDKWEGIAWNLCPDKGEAINLELSLPEGKDRVLITETVDELCCNPLKVWHDLGEPASLSDGELQLLRTAGRPAIGSERLGETQPVCLHLNENAVVHFTVKNAPLNSDYGYDYHWYDRKA